MKASSASGLCARRIARVRLAATHGLPGGAGRLLVKGVEVALMVGVLGSLAGALRGFVPEEITVGPSRPGGVAPQLERPGPQHEREEVSRDRPVDRVRLGQRPGLVAAGQVENSDVITRIHVATGRQ